MMNALQLPAAPSLALACHKLSGSTMREKACPNSPRGKDCRPLLRSLGCLLGSPPTAIRQANFPSVVCVPAGSGRHCIHQIILMLATLCPGSCVVADAGTGGHSCRQAV